MQRILLTLNDQGGGVMSWNYDETVGTLRREMKHHEPIVVIEVEDDLPESNRPSDGEQPSGELLRTGCIQ